MKTHAQGLRRRAQVALLGCGVTVFQLGGCDLANITTTTTTTLDGRQVLIDLILGIVLTPIEAAVTNAVNNLVGADEE